VTFIRTIVASAGLLAIVHMRSGPLRIERRDWWRLTLLWLLGVAPISICTLWIAVSPPRMERALRCYTNLCSGLSKCYDEQITRRKNTRESARIPLGFRSSSSNEGVEFFIRVPVRNALILVAVVAWTVFNCPRKSMILKYGALRTTSAMMLTGAITFLPGRDSERTPFPFHQLTLRTGPEFCILSIELRSGILPLGTMHASRIDGKQGGCFHEPQPVFATILSVLFLDYSITAAFVMGSITHHSCDLHHTNFGAIIVVLNGECPWHVCLM